MTVLRPFIRSIRTRGWSLSDSPATSSRTRSRAEIAEFCRLNHGVTFPLMGKIEVNGAGEHPIYTYLKANAQGEKLKGLKAKAAAKLFKSISKSVEKESDIKWNFTKFLISRDGSLIKRFEPTTTPEAIEKDITEML